MSFDPNTINLVKPTDKALIGTLIDGDAFLVFRGDSTNFTTYRFNYQSLVALIQTFIPDITVIDTLSSNSSANALSAKQGTVLKGLVDDLITAVGNKLDTSAYNEHYRGTYTTLGNLQTALPTANDGNYAIVDTGTGNDAVYYIWDAEDGWVSGGSISGSTTDDVTEGSTNLYFTSARAISAVTATINTAVLASLEPTINTQSVVTSYTVGTVSTDNDGKTILRMDNASANTVEITTAQTKPISIRQAGAGTTTLVAGSGVTLNGTLAFTAQHQTKTVIPLGSGIYDVVG